MTTVAWGGAPSPDRRRPAESAHYDLYKALSALVPFVADTLPAFKKSVEQTGNDWLAD
jgi:hypothetical protein